MSINDQLIAVSAVGTMSVVDILQSSALFRNDEIITLMHRKQLNNGVLPWGLCTMKYYSYSSSTYLSQWIRHAK